MSSIDFAAFQTIAQARRALARAFADASLDTPALDARVLIGHALGLDHAALVVRSEQPIHPVERKRIEDFAARRLRHEPVARIIGSKEFWSLPIAVSQAVLVPRPETEIVVAAALAAIDETSSRTRGLTFADLGTGSGAILVALLHELPQARAIGTDRDVATLAMASDNARRLGVACRARFIACDFGAAIAGPLDFVVSNPPYVARGDIARLPPEVRDHDPALALDGGRDGLDAYRAIAADARRLLAPGGRLVVELGVGQADAVARLFSEHGLEPRMPPEMDLSGTPRALWVLRVS